MKLVFDTETSGLPQCEKFGEFPFPTDLEKYKDARLIELGYFLLNDDNLVIDKGAFLVNVDFEIKNSNIHGITNEHTKSGEPIERVLSKFFMLLVNVDTIIAHNIMFDISIIASECCRCGMTDIGSLLMSFVSENKIYDTMKVGHELIKNFIKIFAPNVGWVKYPKLSELYEFLFKTKVVQTHRALDDVSMCYDCYIILLQK